jgi:hypothetical protein
MHKPRAKGSTFQHLVRELVSVGKAESHTTNVNLALTLTLTPTLTPTLTLTPRHWHFAVKTNHFEVIDRHPGRWTICASLELFPRLKHATDLIRVRARV